MGAALLFLFLSLLGGHQLLKESEGNSLLLLEGGATLLISFFAFFLNGHLLLLKERVCFCRSHSFSLRVGYFLKGFVVQGNSHKSYLLCAMVERCEYMLMHLKRKYFSR